MSLILASQSPRRYELLTQRLGLAVTVAAADIDETPNRAEAPVALVQRLSRRKVEAVKAEPDDLVIAADTIVLHDAQMLGKPRDKDDAKKLLRLLSGEEHSVLTGVSVRYGEHMATGVERTKITFRRLTAKEIDWYVATGEPMDKAGGYAIQGIASIFVDHLDGSETNVIGLPLGMTYRLAQSIGQDLMAYWVGK